MNLKKWLLKLIPMNKKLILFESVDMGDNAKALYNEMQLQGLLSKYRTVWVVRDKKKHQALFPSVKFITQKDLSYQLFYKFMAKYTFYTHNFTGSPFREHQVRCFLTHGIPLKDTRKCFWDAAANTDIICTSQEAAKLRCKTFGGGEDRVRLLGFPRNDELLLKSDAKDKLGIIQTGKLIVWMPTFKHQVDNGRNDFKTDKAKDIGLLDGNLMARINDQLAKADATLVMKYHPNQNMDFVDRYNLSNIRTYVNQDLYEHNVGIYELLAAADGLITDFSSVFFDYLLCDRPIGFELNDLSDYDRGFLVDNPLDYMPGKKITNADELQSFISDVINDLDEYKEERNALKHRFHKNCDGDSAKRILSYFNIK